MATWEPKRCSCCVLLIKYILCNKVVLDYKFIYFIKQPLTTPEPRLPSYEQPEQAASKICFHSSYGPHNAESN